MVGRSMGSSALLLSQLGVYNMATKQTPNPKVGDDHKNALIEYLIEHAKVSISPKSGRPMITVPDAEYKLTLAGLTGQFNFAWYGLQDASLAEMAAAKRRDAVLETTFAELSEEQVIAKYREVRANTAKKQAEPEQVGDAKAASILAKLAE